MSRVMQLLRQLSGGVLDHCGSVVFPPVCSYCDCDVAAPPRFQRLCQECSPKLIEPPTHRCRKCAAKVAETFQGDDCPWCREEDFRFERAFALGSYHDDLREAIIRLKHPGQDALGTALAEALVEKHRAAWEAAEFDVVVPVPMHWWRRTRQGHNGPELTAALIARRLGVRDYPRLLTRRKLTRPQAGLTHPQRHDNVRNAFALRAGYRVEGARALIVDDILTSGATCSEAARTLRRAGAKSVAVAVLARAQREGK